MGYFKKFDRKMVKFDQTIFVRISSGFPPLFSQNHKSLRLALFENTSQWLAYSLQYLPNAYL